MHLAFIQTALLVVALLLSCSSSAITFFNIREYRIEGVKSVDAETIYRAVEDYLGTNRTIADVDKATQAIQKVYRQAGYPTTAISVPDQDIDSGIITIVVDESEVRRLKVVGARYFSPEKIRKQFDSAQPGTVLNFSELQSDVQNANRLNRDLKVVPALEASPKPGAVDVNLNVADTLPFHAGLETTNYHTETTSDLRFSADFRYGNLWQRNHEISFQYQTTPENPDEVSVFATSYLFPVNDTGGKVAVYAVDTASELAVAVSDINVIGDGQIYGARWVQPIMQTPNAVHSISLGGDYKDFKEDLELPGDLTVTTPIQYATLSAQYNLFHRSEAVTDSFSTGFSFGSRLLINDSSEFGLKRSQADTGFVLWRLSWERTYSIFSNWAFTHSIRGQLTESPLISNEQQSAGGVSSVRGYFESQIQGDSGWIGSLKLATPSWSGSWYGAYEVTPYLFYDAARVAINEPLADQQDRFAISSIGLGVIASLLNNLNIKVEGAYPLTDMGSIETGDFRTGASLRYEF